MIGIPLWVGICRASLIQAAVPAGRHRGLVRPVTGQDSAAVISPVDSRATAFVHGRRSNCRTRSAAPSLKGPPAFFVYLEDVAPNGRVTFLTEGQFWALHRRPGDPATLPCDPGPSAHNLLRANVLDVSAGERMQVEFALSSVAARIRAGHGLRIAIGGADTHMFMTYANRGPVRFDVFVGTGGSTITVPMRLWVQEADAKPPG